MNYFYHLATLMCLYLLLAQSMNMYLGFTGILALCHIAFYGIGAYTSALLVMHGAPFELAFLAAGILPALLSILLGLTSIRLKADYLGIATLGFAQIVSSILQNWDSLTRGALGLAGIPKPEIFGVTFADKASFFYLTAGITAVLMFIMYRILKSPFGRVLETIRDDEVAAMSLGKNTVAYKLTAFGIGALVAGFAGSLFAHFITFIDPASFVINDLSLILVITVLGGLGTFRGPFLGVLAIMVFFEPLRFLPLPAEYLGPLRLWIYSLLFVLTLRFVPSGLGGLWKHRSRHGQQFTRY
jgi:branched-chain amino acid transport system permease protein